MKKIIITLSTALFALACTQFVEETKPEFKAQPGAPSIEAVEDAELDSDNAFKVKIAPGKENIYYSFAIIPGADPVDGATLLSNGYAKSAVSVKLTIDGVEADVPLSGCFKAAALKDTTVTAFKLKPNTQYTVYAIGSGEKGVLSEVATKTITTTDKTAPSAFDVDEEGKVTKYYFDASGIDDGTIVIDFGDPVQYTKEGEAGITRFTAKYFAANDYDAKGILNPQFSVDIPLDSVSISGGKVSLQVPERIPGAIVGIYCDEGIFQNAVGLKNPAIPYEAVLAAWSSGKIATAGPVGRFETEAWSFDLPMVEDPTGKEVKMPADSIIFFQDWEALEISLTAPALAEPKNVDKVCNALFPAEVIQVMYTDGNNRKIIYDTDDYDRSAVSDSTIVVKLAESPEYGSSVAIQVPEGAVEDVWGNPCEEFSTAYIDEDGDVFAGNYFFSYGYTLADIVGTYTLNADTQYAGKYTNAEVVIAPAPADDEDFEDSDLAIYNLFKGMPCCDDIDVFEPISSVFGASFNPHNGNLHFDWYGVVGMGSYADWNFEGYVLAITMETEDNTFSFQMPSKGNLVLSNTLAIYLNGKDGGGTWDRYRPGTTTLVRTSTEYEVPVEEEEEEGGDAGAPRKLNGEVRFSR